MAFDFPASPVEGQFYAPAGGPLYVFNNPAWKIAGITSVPGEWKINEIWITTTGPYAKPANLAYLEVEIMAPGAGGGGCNATAAGNYAAGGGGGAGGWGRKLYAAADVAASTMVTIGAAGTGTTGTGGTGGSTSFGSLVASGGGGGLSGSAGPSGGHSAGVGGSTAGFDLDGRSGGGGTQSFWYVTGSLIQRGYGANSLYGMGGPGGTSAADGQAAQGYGSGGSGAGNLASAGAARPGGVGAPGFIRLREYYPAWVLNAAQAPGTIVETLVTSTQPYVKPAGLKFLEVEGVAPGGGGGAAIATGVGVYSVGGGGGAGADGKKLFAAADLPASLTITIGAAGASAAPGGASSFGALGTLAGGVQGNNSVAAALCVANAGVGGVATGFTVNGAGQWGVAGIAGLMTTYLWWGQGAGSPFGGGGQGGLTQGTGVGNNASGYGAGGSGAGNTPSQGAGKAGGSGSPGFFLLREFY